MPRIASSLRGLTVLDIDTGLHSVEHALAWAESHGIPDTYMVVSGRETFGVHFYLRGVRTLSDCHIDFDDSVSGDLKCHGHVVAEGGLHKSGRFYYSPNPDAPVGDLPSFLRDYSPKKKYDTTDEQGRPNTTGLPIRDERGMATTVKRGDRLGRFVARGNRHKYLMNRAGHLRREGGSRQSIYSMLKDIREQLCVDSFEIPDRELELMADYVAKCPVDLVLSLKWVGVTVRDGETHIITKIPTARQKSVVDMLAKHLQTYPEGMVTTTGHMLSQMQAHYPYLKIGSRMIRRALKSAGYRKVGHGRGCNTQWIKEDGYTLSIFDGLTDRPTDEINIIDRKHSIDGTHTQTKRTDSLSNSVVQFEYEDPIDQKEGSPSRLAASAA